MKAILEFDLPEEKEEYETIIKANDYYLALFDIFNYLRNKLKYEDLEDKEYDIYEKIRDRLSDILVDYNIDL